MFCFSIHRHELSLWVLVDLDRFHTGSPPCSAVVSQSYPDLVSCLADCHLPPCGWVPGWSHPAWSSSLMSEVEVVRGTHMGGVGKETLLPRREEACGTHKSPGRLGSASQRLRKLVQQPQPWILRCRSPLVFILINALGDNLNC